MSGHFKNVCEFSQTHGQCRCPSLTKDIRKVKCPTPAACRQVNPYPPEELGEDEDDGTMVNNKAEFEKAVIGHRIIDARNEVVQGEWSSVEALVITLDNGKRVILRDTDDCCAMTQVEKFVLNADKIEHAITGVGTTDGYTKWHIFADHGDIMQIEVGWSAGNPFYYGYGFDIAVEDNDNAISSVADEEFVE